jgi:hypothetical protein
MIVTIRNTQINTEAVEQYTEAEFRETFAGIVDLELACKELKKYFKEDVQKIKKTSRKRKESKSEDTFSDSI